MAKKPKFVLSRDGTTINISMLNREGKTAAIFKTNGHLGKAVQVAEIGADSYSETVNAGERVAYLIRYRELEFALTVVADFSASDPPYYTVETTAGGSLIIVQETLSVSWGSDVIYDLIRVSGISFGVPSIRKYTNR